MPEMESISLIVPTFNERETIAVLVERVERALDGRPYELIFVDDSTDGTDELIERLQAHLGHICLIHRSGRLGLASAVAEGIAAARHETICVLDADLQHPPEALPRLLAALETTGADLAVGSRYVPGGGYHTLTGLRRLTSQVATALARLLLRRARQVLDPLSGFFIVRRKAIEGIVLRPVGYKILLELLVRGRICRVVEVPYHFETRTAGQSKLTMRQQWEYLLHLSRLVRVHPDDLRFLRFVLVGASGVAVNMGVLWLLTRLGLYYLYAGGVAVVSATSWNFIFNDAFTWRDRRSTSIEQKAVRYGQYWAVTGVGSTVHLMLLYLLTSAGVPYLISNLGGIAAAVAWNFRANGRWTWKGSKAEVKREVHIESSLPAHEPPSPLAELAARKRTTFVRHLKKGPVPAVEIISGDGVSAPPRVSVIIPVANRSRSHHLAGLVEELKSQPFRQYEVILVRGDTRQGRAINTGAAIAHGDILVTMDDDTKLGDPQLLVKLVAAMDHDPSIGIAGVANLIPGGAPRTVQRAMRELPRRSSPLVNTVTDSDMAEHPCLAIRKELFYQVGGELETIPRGLDPYLRREVRRLGYRVVVIPETWIHHLLPPTARAILRQYFRNGVGAAYVRKFYPDFVIEQAEKHGEAIGESGRLSSRARRYAGRLVRAVRGGMWMYLGTLLTYAAGYLWGTLTLREDSL